MHSLDSLKPLDSLVSVQWLAARLRDSHVLVLDATLPPVGVQPIADVHALYIERHVPGAVFFNIETLSDQATTLPHMLLSPESFGERVSDLGVGEAMTLVVYEQGAVFSAPRAWWMLRTMGARDVHVLDGGLGAWIDAGYETESGVTAKPRAKFGARPQPDAVRSFADMQALLADGPRSGQVLDARSAGRFAGTAPEPRAGLPSGHMPGAINLPYTELVRNGRFKDVDELRAVFAAAGVDLSAPITTSCGSGVTAAVLTFALERCGASQVSLYDGSWAEYAGRPDAVIAV